MYKVEGNKDHNIKFIKTNKHNKIMKTEKRLVVNNEKYSFELLMAGIPSNVFTWQQVLSPSRKEKKRELSRYEAATMA